MKARKSNSPRWANFTRFFVIYLPHMFHIIKRLDPFHLTENEAGGLIYRRVT
jgi:hypothetical protein